MIWTLRPDGRDGVYMNEEVYHSIQAFFIAALEKETELTLAELICRAEQKLSDRLIHDIGYNLIHIKLDLLARNVIRQTSSPGRRIKLSVISSKRKGKYLMRNIKDDESTTNPDKKVATIL